MSFPAEYLVMGLFLFWLMVIIVFVSYLLVEDL